MIECTTTAHRQQLDAARSVAERAMIAAGHEVSAASWTDYELGIGYVFSVAVRLGACMGHPVKTVEFQHRGRGRCRVLN